jgi:DNA-binding CsgD family transcriptional regulator
VAETGRDRRLRVAVAIAGVRSAPLAALLEGRPEIALVDPDEAEVVLADGQGMWAAATVLVEEDGAGREDGEASLVRPEVDAATLVAVLRAAACGYRVRPVGRRPALAPAGPTSSELTPREQDVLALLADGASNKVIARQLGIAPSTAKFHVASLLDKLGARNRLDAVTIGMRRGLVLV